MSDQIRAMYEGISESNRHIERDVLDRAQRIADRYMEGHRWPRGSPTVIGAAALYISLHNMPITGQSGIAFNEITQAYLADLVGRHKYTILCRIKDIKKTMKIDDSGRLIEE